MKLAGIVIELIQNLIAFFFFSTNVSLYPTKKLTKNSLTAAVNEFLVTGPFFVNNISLILNRHYHKNDFQLKSEYVRA